MMTRATRMVIALCACAVIAGCHPSAASLERDTLQSITDSQKEAIREYTEQMQACLNETDKIEQVVCNQKAISLARARMEIVQNSLTRLCEVTHPRKITCYETSNGVDCEIPRDQCH
jgi:hypothetical protein